MVGHIEKGVRHAEVGGHRSCEEVTLLWEGDTGMKTESSLVL